MSWLTATLTSSIGKKVVVAITGLFLIFFLVSHLTTNLLMFLPDNGRTYNMAVKFLTETPIVKVAEIILALGFLAHIVQALAVTIANNKSRGDEKYAVAHKHQKVSPASKAMHLSGIVVLAFLVLHLQNFYYRFHFGDPGLDAYGNQDMYTLVVTVFKAEWWVSVFYVIAMYLLGLHLNHGFQSAFRSLGLVHNKYTPAINFLGLAFSVVVPALFAIMPIYFLIFG